MLSAFKDKNIGHSLGRLDDDYNISDLNYIKVNNQGIDQIYDKYYIVGLSDILCYEKEDKSRQMMIVTIFREDKTDVNSVHRGLLSVIRIKKDAQTGFSRY